MNLASHQDRIEAKLATVASLTIREAARLVAGLGQRAARHRLEPRDDHLLVANGTAAAAKYQIIVHPSIHAGFFHLAGIIDPTDGRSAELCTTEKAVPPAAFAYLEEQLGLASIELSIEEHLSSPVRKNPFAEGSLSFPTSTLPSVATPNRATQLRER